MENMLTKTEMEVLEQLGKGVQKPSDIARALKKTDKHVYRIIKSLKQKGFVKHERARITPSKTVFTNLLLQLLTKYPNLESLLADSGIKILTVLVTPKNIREITKETGFKKSIVYRKLRQALKISVIKKADKKYVFNERLWSTLKDFLLEYKVYYESVDPRVPADSIIYYKTDKEIVFSNKAELDASSTAFSVFKDYGIKLLLPTNYYYLPKKKLTKKQILKHALYITEKEKTIRHLTYIALFYLKFKPKIKHPILDDIKFILKEKKLKGYPSFGEIKEKAEIYDIKI